jgi:hypothetical protein
MLLLVEFKGPHTHAVRSVVSGSAFAQRHESCDRIGTGMKRRNVQQAFVGEPTTDPHEPLEQYAEGDEAVDIEVRGGKILVVVPAGTPDAELLNKHTFLGGELELEDGRILSFQIQDGAVGATATVRAASERDRGVGLSSIPDVPSGI